jgi:para-nitrobenzyl esterase
MVYVHGGSNSGGWSYEPNYLGMNLAARGAVVVTVAYRLGPFGFFAHPALDNGPGEPVANFGLLDIRAAFDWVHRHIPAFGGDPGNITGFGESAGAFNLVDLMLADIAAGKGRESRFRRVISQSIGGSLLERQTLAEEQEVGRELAALAGLDDTATADQLRGVPAADWVKAAGQLPPDHYFDGVLDGLILKQHPLEAIRRMGSQGIDLLIGSNRDEWYMYLDEATSMAEVEAWVAANSPGHGDELLTAAAGFPEPRQALDWLSAGHDMHCPGAFLARRVNEGGGRAWVYHFTRQRAGPGGERLRAYHGTELPYVFDRHDAWLPVEAVDRELTGTVMNFWLQFARRGDPNAAGLPAWPMFENPGDPVMELGESSRAVAAPFAPVCHALSGRFQNGE